jgi:hypothetical protein
LPTTPKQVVAGSHTKFWWRCEHNHAWFTTSKNRLKGQGCGVCNNRRIDQGVNDLASTHPELAGEWHPTRNLPLTPNDIFAGSPKKYWWQCLLGHEWMATSSSRTTGKRCPFCSNNRVLTGFNDLATTHPSIAAEWHPTRNFPLTPLDVIAGTPKRIWWQCNAGHEWVATGNKRYMKRGCPSCASFGFDSSKPGVLYFVIRDVETNLLRWIRKDLGLPQYLTKEDMGTHRGETETFSMEGVRKSQVIAKIETYFTKISDNYRI